jgi:hypothetical protein
VFGQYEKVVDRESAYEKLKGRAAGKLGDTQGESGGMMDKVKGTLGDVFGEATGLPTGSNKKVGRTREGLGETMMKSVTRAIGSQIGRSIIRGVLGSIMGGRGKF